MVDMTCKQSTTIPLTPAVLRQLSLATRDDIQKLAATGVSTCNIMKSLGPPDVMADLINAKSNTVMLQWAYSLLLVFSTLLILKR